MKSSASTHFIFLQLILVVVLVQSVPGTTCSSSQPTTTSVRVDDEGVDTPICLEGANASCRSLSYVMSGIANRADEYRRWVVTIGSSQTLSQWRNSPLEVMDFRTNSSIAFVADAGHTSDLYIDFYGLKRLIRFVGLVFVNLALFNLPFLETGLFVEFHDCYIIVNTLIPRDENSFINLYRTDFSRCRLEYVLDYSKGFYSVLGFYSSSHVSFTDCMIINGGLNPLITFNGVLGNATIVFNRCEFHHEGNRLNLHFSGYQSKWIICLSNYQLTINNSLFTSNDTSFESISSVNSLITGGDQLIVNIENTRFERNRLINSEYSALLLFRVIIRLHLFNVQFVSNFGGAAVSFGNGNISLAEVSFINNTGAHTGGISFSGTYIMLNVQMKNLYFKNNTFIDNYGGAIYFETNPCYLVEFKQSGIHFHDQTQFLFSSRSSCAYKFKGMDVNYIRTVPASFKMGSTNITNITLFPGQPIVINSINITDYFGHETSCTATPYDQTSLTTHDEAEIDAYSNITLQGKKLVFIQSSKSIETSLYFTSAYEHISSQHRLIKLKCPTVESYVNVTFRPCTLGYVFNSNSNHEEATSGGICQKSTNDSNLVYDTVSGVVCIKHNYWYGNMQVDMNITALCSPPFCRVGYPCTITGYTKTHYMLPWTQDEQCSGLYGGFLCKSCAVGSVFTFGASSCLPQSKCREHWQPYMLLVLAIGGQMAITICMILLKPVTRMGVGYLYGPLFFISVYKQLPISNSLIHSWGTHLDIVLSVYRSVLLLDLSILGKIPWCFFEDFNQTLAFSLRFLGPLVTFITILIISLMARLDIFRKKFNRVFTSPIQPICLLLLLSFWSLSNISIEIIKPIIVAGEWRFGIQPEYKYFDNLYAIVLWCIATVLLMFVYIPFIIILFSSQFLRKKVNLYRIEPFLDAFQSTFRNSCQWYSSVYLLSWLLLSIDIPLYYFIVLFSAIILLHFFVQPHTSKYMNISDTLLLVDIFVLMSLSFLCDSYGNHCKHPVTIINYPLLVCPLLYILLGGLWLLLKDSIRNCISKSRRLISRLLSIKSDFTDSDERTALMNTVIVFDSENYKSIANSNKRIPVTEVVIEREPLIYHDD